MGSHKEDAFAVLRDPVVQCVDQPVVQKVSPLLDELRLHPVIELAVDLGAPEALDVLEHEEIGTDRKDEVGVYLREPTVVALEAGLLARD
ncbi:hypothetical protein D3C71_1709630 [compost metagenome]